MFYICFIYLIVFNPDSYLFMFALVPLNRIMLDQWYFKQCFVYYQ